VFAEECFLRKILTKISMPFLKALYFTNPPMIPINAPLGNWSSVHVSLKNKKVSGNGESVSFRGNSGLESPESGPWESD
jgi:hypothetical protein